MARSHTRAVLLFTASVLTRYATGFDKNAAAPHTSPGGNQKIETFSPWGVMQKLRARPLTIRNNWSAGYPSRAITERAENRRWLAAATIEVTAEGVRPSRNLGLSFLRRATTSALVVSELAMDLSPFNSAIQSCQPH